MIVRGGRANVRQSAQPADPKSPNAYQVASFPSPTLGWIANGNLATPQPGGASVLENWFPTATGAILRRGLQLYATIGTAASAVTALFAYVNGNIAKLFAANASAIYDITTISQPRDRLVVDEAGNFLVDASGEFYVISASPTAAVSSLTGGAWSVVQFATSGGVFLRAVNGVDTPLVFDGTDWGTTPAITGATPTSLSNVWAFKNRLFFVEKDSLNAWYLPADSIGGLAVVFPLGSVFTRGGSLLFGASWSLDGGGGLSAQCVFFSSEGEVAVYQGTDPSTADTWSLVGVYRIGKPLGPSAFIPAGGDLVIATDIGFIPLSQAVKRDYAALAPSAISQNIETEWNDAVSGSADDDWNCSVWSASQMVVVAPPFSSTDAPFVYVANARTGAWAKFTNWNAKCLIEFNGRAFFGSNNGYVIEANVTGTDLDTPYTGSYVPLFNDLGALGMKVTGMARAVLRGPVAVADSVSVQTDFNISLPSPPAATTVMADNKWGTAIWGQSVWSGTAESKTYQQWRSAPANGYAVSPSLQVTSGSSTPLDVEIIRMDVTFENNDAVV